MIVKLEILVKKDFLGKKMQNPVCKVHIMFPKAHCGSACGLPLMSVRSLPARHVLMGSDTCVTFCQGFLRMKRGRRTALKYVCAHGIKKGPSKQYGENHPTTMENAIKINNNNNSIHCILRP